MKIIELDQTISPELRLELERTMADAAKGVRDPRKMRASAERMDRMREENRRLFGQQEIGVEIIREMHRP